MKKNRKKIIGKLLAEMKTREANNGIEPPDQRDLLEPSAADARIEQKIRPWRAKKAKKPMRPVASRHLQITLVRSHLEMASLICRQGDLRDGEAVSDEINDLLNSRRLLF